MNAFDADLAARCQRAIDIARGPVPLFRMDEVALRRKAADAARKIVALGAERMARPGQRHLITRAVYPFAPTVWPLPGKPATEVLADACRLIAAQEAQGRAGSWTFDVNRLAALRQAETALLVLIMGDEPDAPEAA